MVQQTAVEWLVSEIKNQLIARVSELDLHSLEEQAKAIEKEQIEDAFDTGTTDDDRIGKEYYNETYNY